jgi:hypothetical protein
MGPATSRGQCAQQPARGVPAVSVEVGSDRRAGGIPWEKCPKFRRLLPDVRRGVGHGTQAGILESGKNNMEPVTLCMSYLILRLNILI